MNPLTLSILKTLSYYDGLNWPLTAFEVWKYLYKVSDRQSGEGVTLGRIVSTLDSDVLKEYVFQKNGFYFLKDREQDDLAGRRVEAEKLADMKWKTLRRRAKWMAVVPYIRLVMVSGSIAMGETEELSDFDIFVVTKNGRIWTSRFILTIFFDMLGWRRRPDGQVTKNKFCLNHYVTDASLALASHNVSTALGYYGRLIPILGNFSLFQNFQKENAWLKDYFEHYPWNFDEGQRAVSPPGVLRWMSASIEKLLDVSFGNWFEHTIGAMQAKKIDRNPITHQSTGRTLFSDREMEFHPDGKEGLLIEAFKRRMADLGQTV